MTTLDDFKFIKKTVKRLKKSILEGTWTFEITQKGQSSKVSKAKNALCTFTLYSKKIEDVMVLRGSEMELDIKCKNNSVVLAFITLAIDYDEDDNTFGYRVEYGLNNKINVKEIESRCFSKNSDEYNVYKLIKLSMDELEKAQVKFILDDINS